MKLQFLFFNKLNNKITEIVHELYGQPSYMDTKLCTPFHRENIILSLGTLIFTGEN